MSKRRAAGDQVLVVPGAGFIATTVPFVAVIQEESEEDWTPCVLDCKDGECREWATLQTVDDPPLLLYHVSECEMLDLGSEVMS